ncbi:hypothetical protein DCAR_0102658 [Daucus carota subsp. sativus]|uniref:Uncharacterized protein n=1 Tax=Daucus carota subsp. sativus TaxID=79200 RepID=A0A169WU36_DAUCS|nr:hypothetical protein DCAR_0102658 [Daucus carota subsp. sativus]
MASAQSPSTSQLKLIYWVPVLFCIIILFIFWYLFHLQQRASAFSHPPPNFIRSLSFRISVLEAAVKEILIEKLPTVVFDEELKARDSLCSVIVPNTNSVLPQPQRSPAAAPHATSNQLASADQ